MNDSAYLIVYLCPITCSIRSSKLSWLLPLFVNKGKNDFSWLQKSGCRQQRIWNQTPTGTLTPLHSVLLLGKGTPGLSVIARFAFAHRPPQYNWGYSATILLHFAINLRSIRHAIWSLSLPGQCATLLSRTGQEIYQSYATGSYLNKDGNGDLLVRLVPYPKGISYYVDRIIYYENQTGEYPSWMITTSSVPVQKSCFSGNLHTE